MMTKASATRLVCLISLLCSFSSQLAYPQAKTPAPSLNRDEIKTNFADYIYPTDAGRVITSVFAEHRRTHFHGGIDISTGDEIGFRVFASRDGSIARISVHPTGYGKSIWLRHADGFFTTYSHLSKFSEAIETLVKREQLLLQRYPILIEPKPNELPIKKGDVIAYTGETGTGSPHLHFELRDENKDFVNPLLCPQFAVSDDSIPRIRRIALTPLAENTFVDGSYKSRIIEIQNPIRHAIHLSETLHVSGTIGFAVDARDRINGSRFNSGVYSHKLFLDDSVIFAMEYNRAPSENAHQVRFQYDYDLMSEEEGRYENLYVNSPNDLLYYTPRTSHAGVINSDRLRNGTHTFTIVTQDFNKNTTRVSGTILIHPRPTFSFTSDGSRLIFDRSKESSVRHIQISANLLGTRRRTDRQHVARVQLGESSFLLSTFKGHFDFLKIDATHALGVKAFPQFYFPKKSPLPKASVELSHETESEFVRIHLRTNGAFTSLPHVIVQEGGRTRTLVPIQLEQDFVTATCRPNESIAGKRTVIAECEVNGHTQTARHDFSIYPLRSDKASSYSLDDGKLIIQSDSAALFKTCFLEVGKGSGSSPAYSLLPRYTVLNRGVVIKLRRDPTRMNQSLLYRNASRGSWSLASTLRQGDYIVDTLTRWLGDISLQTDLTPPVVKRIVTPQRYSKQPHHISFRVGDNLSGVEYKELKLYIDDTFVIPEIDGEHRRVVNRLAEPLNRGRHTLRIVLKDRLGNVREVQHAFRVR